MVRLPEKIRASTTGMAATRSVSPNRLAQDSKLSDMTVIHDRRQWLL